MKEALLSGRVRRKHSEGLEDALNPGFALPLTGHADDACPAHVRSTSLPNATLNLVLAVLGAGQLTLPYAMGQLGLALGITCLLIFTLFSMHSLKTLTLYELHFAPSNCLETYAELVIRVLGTPGRAICNALLVMYAWGGAVAFLVILKGESEFLWCNYYDCHHHPEQWHVTILGSDVVAGSGQVILLLLALFVLWPLSSLQDLCFMKRFSWLGCAAALIITGATCWTSWTSSMGRLLEVMRNDLAAPLAQTSALKVAASLPLLSFSLNSSWAFIPILCTLKERTQGYTNGLICGSNLLIFVNYLLLCIFGYCLVDDPQNIKPNILENLGRGRDVGDGGLVLFAKASLCLQLTLALPLRFFVARKTLLGDAGGCARALVAFALVSSATLLALPEISLALVLGLTSSVCASMIIYILPAIIDLKLQLPGFWRKVASLVSFLLGCYILVAGVYANIVGAAVGS